MNMRKRSIVAVCSAFVLLAGGLQWLLSAQPALKPVIAIGVLSYRNGSVVVGITNLGCTTKWGGHLCALCGRLFSDAEGPEGEIHRRFEYPHNEPPAVDGGMRLPFASDALLHAAIEASR